jgi:DNA-binding NarL/FixJ family response regulator
MLRFTCSSRRRPESSEADPRWSPPRVRPDLIGGRGQGQRPSDKKAKRVLALHKEGLSYRLIGRNVGLSKNTVMDIVRRAGSFA